MRSPESHAGEPGPALALTLFRVATAVLSTGYGVMFAVLAKIRDEHHISEARLGWIVAVGFFTSFVAQLWIAPLADRGHGRRLLLGGIAANAAGLAMLTAASSSWQFMAGRALMGFGIGAAHPAIRRAVALADPDHVGTNQGALLSADVVGFLAGPALAALLVGQLHMSIRVPFALAGLLSLAMAPFVAASDFGAHDPEARPPRLALNLLRHRWMQAACLYSAAFFVMIGCFDALWAVRIDDLGGSELYVTLGIIVFGLPLVLLGKRGGEFVERRGPFRTGAVGLLIGAVALSVYGIVPLPWMLVLVGTFHATCDSYTAPSVPIAVTLTAPEEQLAGAQGVVGAVQVLIGGVASAAAGSCYARLGPVPTYGGAAALMVLVVTVGWWRAGVYRTVRKGAPIAADGVAAAPAGPLGDVSPGRAR